MTSLLRERTRHLRQARYVSFCEGTWDGPPSREAQGHGAWIVLVGVTPDQGGQENWSQGEAKQVFVSIQKAGRYCEMRELPKLVEYSLETETNTGERRAWKPASGVRRRAGGKGLLMQYFAAAYPTLLGICRATRRGSGDESN